MIRAAGSFHLSAILSVYVEPECSPASDTQTLHYRDCIMSIHADMTYPHPLATLKYHRLVAGTVVGSDS